MSSLLSLQEKLALSMTTARSPKDLAAFMGVSTQRLMSWLREGEPGGTKQIPNEPWISELVEEAFQAHKEASREVALADGLPFDDEAPVFAHRAATRTGALGDRVVINNAQFIKRDLRTAVFIHLHESQRYYTLSVRSSVQLAQYLGQADARAARKQRGRTELEQVAKAILENHLQAGIVNQAIYTKLESFGPLSDTYTAVKAIERKIKQKHEPATGAKGTVLADQYLLQVIPHDYVKLDRKRAIKTRSRKARSRAKGR